MHTRFGGLHGVALVMDRRGRAREIVDLVHFDIKREGYIVTDDFEVLLHQQVLDIGPGASKIVVDANNVCSTYQQALAEMRTQEPRATCHQYALL